MKLRERKLIRLEENRRVEAGMMREHRVNGRLFYTLESTRADGSKLERDLLLQSASSSGSSHPGIMKFEFQDFEKKPVTEANVMGKEVAVPDGVLGILEFELMASADVKTANSTLYPYAEVKREVAAYKKNYVNRGKAWGGQKHPDWFFDGFRIEFDNAAIRWFAMEFDNETGIVCGAGYLLDKAEGLNVRAGIRSGGIVCVSSRGWGYAEKYSEYEGIHGTVEDVWVIEEYILEGFDIVTDPGAIGAETDSFYTEAKRQQQQNPEPAPVTENRQLPPKEEDQPMNLKELKEKWPELYNAILEEGRGEGRVEANAQFEKGASAREDALIEKLTHGEGARLIERADADALQAQFDQMNEQIEGLTQERDDLAQKVEGLTQERDDLDGKIKAAEAAATRAKVEASVEKALAGHSFKEAIKARLSDQDLASVESAKAAIERELDFHQTHYNIPKSPITQKQIERLGKIDPDVEDNPPVEEDDKTEGDDFLEKMKRIGGFGGASAEA